MSYIYMYGKHCAFCKCRMNCTYVYGVRLIIHYTIILLNAFVLQQSCIVVGHNCPDSSAAERADFQFRLILLSNLHRVEITVSQLLPNFKLKECADIVPTKL